MTIVEDSEDPTIKIDTEKCEHCTGNSAIRKPDRTFYTSQELCSDMRTCTATIDWDKVFSHQEL